MKDKFPIQVRSWTAESPFLAIKKLDKSAFIHGGTGIPKEIAFFFNAVIANLPRDITLNHNGIEYAAQLKLHVDRTRVRLFWRQDFSSLISRLMPDHAKCYTHGKRPKAAAPEMRLTTNAADSSSYEIEFRLPGQVASDGLRLEDRPGIAETREDAPPAEPTMQMNMPLPGDILSNQEITSRFKVGNMGGMRRSKSLNCLVLISDEFKAKYQDKKLGNIFHYNGMGQRGDQEFDRQNRTLRDAKKEGITVHLFEAYQPQRYTYLGEVELSGKIYTEYQADVDGRERKVLMFPLRSATGAFPPVPPEAIRKKEKLLAAQASKRDLGELQKIVKYAQGKPGYRSIVTSCYERNQNVVEFVKRCASGVCHLCEQPAPFKNPAGEPYLEVHHVKWLSEGGDDSVANAVALCPNCHRKMHIVQSPNDIQKLVEIALQMASQL